MSTAKGCLIAVATFVIVFMVVTGLIPSCGSGPQTYVESFPSRVAADLIEQYEITKRTGSAMDAYIRAAGVAEMYLQAKDEENYKKWKEIAKEEGQRAGMPAQ